MGVNFTNILQATFLYKNDILRFLYLQFVFVFFWQEEIGKKAAH